MSDLRQRVWLVTGATGSFGHAFVETLLRDHDPAAVRIYSRDELKQYELRERFNDDPRLRFLIGDVRDLSRLELATRGVDIIIHAAALKQVPACEYNPFEAVQTNVVGAENVVTAAIASGVERVISLSTDKAVNPVNLYGATKLCAEKIITQANAYAADSVSRFSTVRYGNVVGSRGSVIPLFLRQADTGELTITDADMTRFWVTLPEVVNFVLLALQQMEGGEIFVPKLPSMRIRDVADAIAPNATWKTIGIRPGEKVNEILITEDESRQAADFDSYFAIYPAFPLWRATEYRSGGELPPGFRYSSDENENWLTRDQLVEMVGLVSSRD
jgi:UDP-N-acetylglucosamine 4,6-dehydratase